MFQDPRNSWNIDLEVYKSPQQGLYQLFYNFYFLFIIVELHTVYQSILTCSTDVLRPPRTSWKTDLKFYGSN